jgi:hypothetical protein
MIRHLASSTACMPTALSPQHTYAVGPGMRRCTWRGLLSSSCSTSDECPLSVARSFVLVHPNRDVAFRRKQRALASRSAGVFSTSKDGARVRAGAAAQACFRLSLELTEPSCESRPVKQLPALCALQRAFWVVVWHRHLPSRLAGRRLGWAELRKKCPGLRRRWL